MNAFAAILIDGSVVTWGSPFSGGDSSTVQAQLRNVSAIQSTAQAFAAIRTDGSVVTWGGSDYGPGFDVTNSSQVRERLKDVRDIRSSPGAFAALLRDGSVVTWGDSRTVQHQLTNGHAFAAIKADGTVVSWGHPDRGGDSGFFFFCKRRAQSRSRLLRPFRNAAGVYGLAYLRLEPKMLCFWQHQKPGGTKECYPSKPRSVRHVLVECLLLLEWRKIHDL